jgi:CDP-diacylglycerol---glycerol-3-phosphate 3-phosphatidyltransferase
MVWAVNLPNAITFSRLLMTAAYVAAVSVGTAGAYVVGLVLFVVAAISDWFDGWLARRMGLVTPLGKLMDPLADKILVCAAFVFLTERGFCPVWVTALVMGREFLVTGLRQVAIEAGEVLAADRLGKWKTGLQLTYCITGMVWLAFDGLGTQDPVSRLLRYLSDPDSWLMTGSLSLAVVLTLVSGANYVKSCSGLLFRR